MRVFRVYGIGKLPDFGGFNKQLILINVHGIFLSRILVAII